MNKQDSIKHDDPFEILGVDHTATEITIRKRYLELIKLHPPERDADQFRKIHEAYEFAKNPLRLAERLLEPSPHCPEFSTVIEAQKKRPPALSASLMLALGNRPAQTPAAEDSSDTGSSDASSSEGQVIE